MKIPGDDSIHLLETILFGVKKAGKSDPVLPSDKAGGSSQGDRVEISERAKEFQQLNQQIASLPETRFEKVAELQQKMDAGTYHPQSEAIAEKLIRSTLLDAIL